MAQTRTKVGNIMGPAGPQGATGPAGPTGPQGPAGATPVKGVDYWTETDQAQIVQDVLDALPNADAESY